MKIFLANIGLVFIVLALILGMIFTLRCYNEKVKSEFINTIQTEFKKKMELAYFEGQKDYANGDIRIVKNGCVWYWSKSPWDGQDTSRTIFKPENERAEQ